jgi:hypothetical protein
VTDAAMVETLLAPQVAANDVTGEADQSGVRNDCETPC